MIVITAPNEGGLSSFRYNHPITCFLAGGITGCSDWQSEVIRSLYDFGKLEHLVIFNPRRENFPIDDPRAAEKQITWEYNYLNISNIFSMYFDGGDSVQPICMYELGRYLTKCIEHKYKYPTSPIIPIISVNPDYKRAKDVFTQVKLATGGLPKDIVQFSDPGNHALRIMKAYRTLDNLNDLTV